MIRKMILLIGLFSFNNTLTAQYNFLQPPTYYVQTETTKPCCVAIPYPCYEPTPNYEDGLFVFGEFLYWKADQDNLEFCTVDKHPDSNTESSSTPPNLPDDANGKFHFASLDWKPGYRIGVGCPLKCGQWQLLGTYTYYTSEGYQKAEKPSDPNLFLNGNFRENVETEPLLATSDITLKFQQGDVLLAKRFDPTRNIFLKVFMGVTGAYFEQNWTIKYTAPTAQFPINTNKIQNDWKYYGGGGRLGLDLDWNLGKGVSFYGRFSGAVILGRYKFHNFAHNPNFSTLPTGDSHFNETRYVPNTQAGLGFKWFGCVFGAHTDIQIGYELNSWWNIHMLPVTPWIPSGNVGDTEKYTFHRNGNINFQGFTAKIGFLF